MLFHKNFANGIHDQLFQEEFQRFPFCMIPIFFINNDVLVVFATKGRRLERRIPQVKFGGSPIERGMLILSILQYVLFFYKCLFYVIAQPIATQCFDLRYHRV